MKIDLENWKEVLTKADYNGNLLETIESLISAAKEEGRDETVDYIFKEMGIDSDESLNADYVVPRKILDAARTPKETV